MFDCEAGEWLVDSLKPENLETARDAHASCSSQTAAFVYGGTDSSFIAIDTVEVLPL